MNDDCQAQYDHLLAQVLRLGAWLTGPHARVLPPEVWEAQFNIYQEKLEEVRRFGDELRTAPRGEEEPLAGLAGEVTELFGA